MSNRNNLLPTDLKFPKEVKNVLRKTDISIENISIDIAFFSNLTNSCSILTQQTKLRDAYCFCLQKRSFYQTPIFRLLFAISGYRCSKELTNLTDEVWKNSMLDVWEKFSL